VEREFLFNLYRDAWRRRDQLASEMSLPVGLLTLLWGAMILLVRSTPWDSGAYAWLFVLVVLLVFGCAAFFRAAWHLLKSYHGYEYATIPTVADMLAHRASIESVYSEFDECERRTTAAFDAYLGRVLAEATDKNAECNEVRSARLYSSRRAITQTAIFTALATLPWLGVQFVY